MSYRFSLAATVCGAMLFAGLPLLAQVAPPVSIAPVPADAAEAPLPEQPLLDIAQQYVDAYNNHDLDRIVEFYAPDADVVNARGNHLVGREEIRAAMEEFFSENPDSKLSLSIESVRFVTEDVAVEQGEAISFADGEHASTNSVYTIVHVRRDGQWQVEYIRTIKDVPITGYEHLKPLEWLVGDWIDEGADAVVENKCRWSDDQSYLLTEYSVIRDGEVLLSGNQRIGWDPQANQIHSWSFDEGGSVSEATWTLVDGRWIVRSNGVSADGTSGNMTRILEPDGPDRYILTITDRLVGEESLPEIQVTLVRKAPAPQSAAK